MLKFGNYIQCIVLCIESACRITPTVVQGLCRQYIFIAHDIMENDCIVYGTAVHSYTSKLRGLSPRRLLSLRRQNDCFIGSTKHYQPVMYSESLQH